MNKDIMNAMGFSKEIKAVEIGDCPFCGKPVVFSEFKDDLSREEYRISGLCQSCQDETFKEEE